MNKREEISWKFKALIGACGGTCLVMLRLIDANFFIYEEWGTMLGGYLTALGFVVLSTIFTCFVDENNPRKLFTQALLAPSLLIAMVKTGEPVYQERAATAQMLYLYCGENYGRRAGKEYCNRPQKVPAKCNGSPLASPRWQQRDIH